MAEDQKITGSVSATRETFNFTKTKNGFSQEISVGKTTTQVVEFTNKPAKENKDQLLLSINGQVEGKNAELVSFYKGANGGIYLKFSQDFVYGEEYAEFRKNTPFFEAFNRNFFKEYEDKSRDALSFPIEEFVIDKNLDIQIKCANQTKSFGAVFSAFGVQMQLGQQKALCKYTDHANNLVIDKSVFDLALDGKSVCKFGKGMDFKSPVFQNSVNMYAAILQERAMKDNQYVTVKEKHGNSTISTIPYYPYAEGGEKNAEFLNVYTEGTKHYAYFNLAEGDKRLPGTYYEIDTMDLIEPAGEKSRPVVAYTLIDPKNEKVRYHFQQELSENSAEQFKQNASFLLEYSNGKQKEVRNDLTHVINVKEYGVGESARLRRSAQALNTEKPEAEKTEEQGIANAPAPEANIPPVNEGAGNESSNLQANEGNETTGPKNVDPEVTAPETQQPANESDAQSSDAAPSNPTPTEPQKEEKVEEKEEEKKSKVPGFLKSSKFWFWVAVAITVGCLFLPASAFSVAIPFFAFATPEIVKGKPWQVGEKTKTKKVAAAGKEKSNEMSNEAQAVAQNEKTEKQLRKERKLLKKKEKEDLRKERKLAKKKQLKEKALQQTLAADMEGLEQFALYEKTQKFVEASKNNPAEKNNLYSITPGQIKYSNKVKNDAYRAIERISQNTELSKLTDKEIAYFQKRKEHNTSLVKDLQTQKDGYEKIMSTASDRVVTKDKMLNKINEALEKNDTKAIKKLTAKAEKRGFDNVEQYKEYLTKSRYYMLDTSEAANDNIRNICKGINAAERENYAIDGMFQANDSPQISYQYLEALKHYEYLVTEVERQEEIVNEKQKIVNEHEDKLKKDAIKKNNAENSESKTESTEEQTKRKNKIQEQEHIK